MTGTDEENRAFVQGSTMGHVVTMTSAASLGLMTLFVVDLVDMYFLSLLGEIELAAAALSLHMLKKCSGDDGPIPGPRKKPFNLRIPVWPQTSTRG